MELRVISDTPHLLAACDETPDQVGQHEHGGAGHWNDSDGAAIETADTFDGPLRDIDSADDLARLLEQVMGFRHRMQAPRRRANSLNPISSSRPAIKELIAGWVR